MAKRRKPSAPVKQASSQTRKRAASQPKKSQPRSRSAGGRHSQAGRSPLERAQDLAWKAFEATDIDRRISLAQQALELSPDCADAYTVLARVVTDPRQALMLLEQGLA